MENKDKIKKLVKLVFEEILKEQNVNEIGPKMAALAFKPKFDERTRQIQKDAITSLFSEYIGRDIPFYLKTGFDKHTPTKYKLVEATFDSLHNKQLKLYFYNENGVDNDAPFIDNKKEIVLIYDMDKDDYIYVARQYTYNQFAVNLLIKSANLIREAYYTRWPIEHMVDKSYPVKYEVDQFATENAKRTKLTKQHFQIFSFDSQNLLNK